MQIKRKLQNKAFVKKFEWYNQKSLGWQWKSKEIRPKCDNFIAKGFFLFHWTLDIYFFAKSWVTNALN